MVNSYCFGCLRSPTCILLEVNQILKGGRIKSLRFSWLVHIERNQEWRNKRKPLLRNDIIGVRKEDQGK